MIPAKTRLKKLIREADEQAFDKIMDAIYTVLCDEQEGAEK